MTKCRPRSLAVALHFFSLPLGAGMLAAAPIGLAPESIKVERVPVNEALVRNVRITNYTKEQLTIISINSDCSCTVAEPGKKSLAPGEWDQIEVKVSAPSRAGTITRKVDIATSAGNVTIPITVSYVDHSNWDVSHTVVQIPDTNVSQPEWADIVIKAVPPNRFKVTRVSTDSPWYRVTVSTSGLKQIVRVTKSAAAPAGLIDGSILIETDDPSATRINIPAYAVVHAGVFVVPNPIVLPVTKLNEPSSITIQLGGVGDLDGVALRSGAATISRQGDHTQRRLLYEVVARPDSVGSKTERLFITRNDKIVASFPIVIRGRD